MAVTVKSEMSGLIEEIMLSVGDAVEAESEVLILSSMKMEIPILAGTSGKIAEILVEDEEAVTTGTPLFSIAT